MQTRGPCWFTNQSLSYNITPESFQIGDIVEVLFRIALVRTPHNIMVPTFVLSTLVKLDNSFSSVCLRETEKWDFQV